VRDTLFSFESDSEINHRVTVRPVAVMVREMLDVFCEEGDSVVLVLLGAAEALDVSLRDAVNIRDSVIVAMDVKVPVIDARVTRTDWECAMDALSIEVDSDGCNVTVCDGVFWTADAVGDSDAENEARDGEMQIEVDAESLNGELDVAESLIVEVSEALAVSVR
jgi:hypothetical protein